MERKFSVYPTTQLIMGEITTEQHIAQSAEALYDEWCIDRRWDPEDVIQLLLLECEKRGIVVRNR